MATRALIGWIESDAAGNQVLTSTYNHYDGYPENLGVGLNKFYDEPNEALKVASMGYISFLNPETGEIESKHNDPAEKTVLPDDFEEAMRETHAVADSMGADYVYLYDHDENNWMHSKMNGVSNLIKTFSMSGIDNQFNSYEDDQDLGVPGDNALGLEEDDKDHKHTYKQIDPDGTAECTKCGLRNSDPSKTGEKVVKEGDEDIVAKAKSALKGKSDLKIYIDSLTNDIRLNGDDAYADYGDEDWVEDFDNYISDKSDLDESIKTRMLKLAGIIK
tara:strand:- start:110 stop:934 length:825 start_codon:yes stop_codon:yes gene_type:complete